MRFDGIIDTSLKGFICVRGYATVRDICKISKADPSYQRDLIPERKEMLEKFWNDADYLFFPEIILGGYFDDEYIGLKDVKNATTESLPVCLNEGKKFKGKFGDFSIETFVESNYKSDISNGVYVVRVTRAKIELSETILKKSLLKKTYRKLTRIDGNHRLSIFDLPEDFERLDKTIKEKVQIKFEELLRQHGNKLVPYCIILFDTKERFESASRVVFHNINTKQVPLKMEENLKVIIQSEDTFDNNTLKESPAFGWNYYLTRKLTNSLDFTYFPNIQKFIEKEKYTFFIELFEYFYVNSTIKYEDETVDIIKRELVNIECALKDMSLINDKCNIAMIAALSYYKLTDVNKYEAFCKWIQKNEINSISDIKISSIINVFDKIYDNRPKKAFMSMWFNDQTKDTYEKVKKVKEILKKDFNITLDVIRVDDNEEGYSEVISQRIYDGLNQCDLLIADVSYNNKNVHHEIGYAQGLGKKVLMIYHNREGEKPENNIGSNISMHEQLRFNTYTDLERELLNKLKDFFDIK